MNQEEKSLWDRILNGDLDIDDPEVTAMERHSNIFAKEVAELRQVKQELAQAELNMNEILNEARSAPILDSDLKLLDKIPQLKDPQSTQLGEQESGGHSPVLGVGRFGRWASAAAALLLAVLGITLYQGLGKGTSPDPGPAMGTTANIKLTVPIASPAEFARFEWEGKLEFGDWYVVHVLDLDTNRPRTSDRLNDNQWTPTEPITSRNIRWFVELHSSSGKPPRVSPSVEVSR